MPPASFNALVKLGSMWAHQNQDWPKGSENTL